MAHTSAYCTWPYGDYISAFMLNCVVGNDRRFTELTDAIATCRECRPSEKPGSLHDHNFTLRHELNFINLVGRKCGILRPYGDGCTALYKLIDNWHFEQLFSLIDVNKTIGKKKALCSVLLISNGKWKMEQNPKSILVKIRQMSKRKFKNSVRWYCYKVMTTLICSCILIYLLLKYLYRIGIVHSCKLHASACMHGEVRWSTYTRIWSYSMLINFCSLFFSPCFLMVISLIFVCMYWWAVVIH